MAKQAAIFGAALSLTLGLATLGILKAREYGTPIDTRLCAVAGRPQAFLGRAVVMDARLVSIFPHGAYLSGGGCQLDIGDTASSEPELIAVLTDNGIHTTPREFIVRVRGVIRVETREKHLIGAPYRSYFLDQMKFERIHPRNAP